MTSDNPNVTQWGQSYNYDGFGNLTDQNVIKGSAPEMHFAYSAATNRITNDIADANGNLFSAGLMYYGYDIENRLVRTATYGGLTYAYDPSNKRVWRGDGQNLDEITFWGVTRQKLATYGVSSGLLFNLSSYNVYFGGKLVANNTGPVKADRLGSIGKFYPYGQERPSATTNDKEKFTGYFRDAATGLDYADQRYYSPGTGFFMTPDFAPSSSPSDPGSWNKYAYVGGDPINRTDQSGLHWDDDWGYGLIRVPSFGGGAHSILFDLLAIAQAAAAAAQAADPFWYPESPPTPPDINPNDFLPKDDARKALGKPSCYGLLGFDSAGAAQSWFDKTKFNYASYGRLRLRNDAPAPNTPAPANAGPRYYCEH